MARPPPVFAELESKTTLVSVRGVTRTYIPPPSPLLQEEEEMVRSSRKRDAGVSERMAPPSGETDIRLPPVITPLRRVMVPPVIVAEEK